jgi:sugar lactone lactonase YvrE
MNVFLGSNVSLSNNLGKPFGLTLDSNSKTLYVADTNNDRIVSYVLGASTATIVAGNATLGPSSVQLIYPTAVYFDSLSNSFVIVNLATHNAVRWALGANNWTLIIGTINGLPGNNASMLDYPVGLVVDPMGNLYVADSSNNRIQFFLADQSVGTTLAGMTGILGNSSILLNNPNGLALDNQLNLYVADTGNHRIQKFCRY